MAWSFALIRFDTVRRQTTKWPFEFNIDGGPMRRQDLFTRWTSSLHIPCTHVLDADLTPGRHELEPRVCSESNPSSKGHAVRIVNMLAN